MASAIFLTMLAGLATGVGGAIAFAAKKTNTRFLTVSLGFAAGVMLYFSLTDILLEAVELLENALGGSGPRLAVGCFFAGVVAIGLLDRLAPHDHVHGTGPDDEPGHTAALHSERKNLMRTGLFTALAVMIHNIPEGIAMFLTILRQPSAAAALVIAVALHNIPAGIAVALPIYYASGKKSKAFFYALVTGLSQPVAAVIGYGLLLPYMNDVLFGVLYAVVAGVMVFISLDDLLPSAFRYGERHEVTYGLVVGMAVMAVSLLVVG